MELEFKPLAENDIPIVKEIYDYFVLNSTATFHTIPVSPDYLKEMIPVDHPKYRSYLIKVDNQICGYAYFAQYKNRPAYDRTAEVTIYLKQEYAGKGLGKAALQRLEEDMVKAGEIKVIIAVLSADNAASIKLFEKAGYERCAHFKQVGEKFGKILDVLVYQKII